MTQHPKHSAVISETDRKRISQAIRQAEQHTSGEIYAVLARQSDDYFYVAGFMAACGVLISAVIAAVIADYYWFSLSLPKFAVAVAVAFLSALLLLWLVPSLRMLMVPLRIRYKRAHLNAVQQFVARNVHLTSQRTGILLFVSLAEHYAEVVADAGIHAKVEQQEWNAIVAHLTKHAAQGSVAEGFLEAIVQSGKLLQKHVPVTDTDVNELPDHLIEL